MFAPLSSSRIVFDRLAADFASRCFCPQYDMEPSVDIPAPFSWFCCQLGNVDALASEHQAFRGLGIVASASQTLGTPAVSLSWMAEVMRRWTLALTYARDAIKDAAIAIHHSQGYISILVVGPWDI